LAVLTINDYENTSALTVPLDVLQKTGNRHVFKFDCILNLVK